jgi:hypothetical protein
MASSRKIASMKAVATVARRNGSAAQKKAHAAEAGGYHRNVSWRANNGGNRG